MSSSSTCTPEHVYFCFDVLDAELRHLPEPEPHFDGEGKSYPLFVTWNKYARSDHEEGEEPALAGCIGQFTAQPVVKGIRDYALTSALRDSRFNPIRLADLPRLNCQVSLLTPFEPIADPLGWEIGLHGIYLTFHIRINTQSTPRKYNACYLPEVAQDQGWTKVETLMSLFRKAGYRGRVQEGDEVWESMEVLTFRSEKCDRDWQDWVEWKRGKSHIVGAS